MKKRTIYVLLVLFVFCGCTNNKRFDELENKLLLLEKQSIEIEKENESLKRERDSIQRNIFILEQEKNELVRANDSQSQANAQPDVRWLGRVDMYYVDMNNEVNKREWAPGSEGLYVRIVNGVETYELHTDGFIYYVAIGKFQLSANNGFFEFSAHAGRYYFDI